MTAESMLRYAVAGALVVLLPTFAVPGRALESTDAGTRLQDANRSAGDFFGTSVAVSGTVAVIGSPQDDEGTGLNKVDSGSAFVFAKRSGIWGSEAKLLASDRDDNERFGTSVAVGSTATGSRTIAVIGAPGILELGRGAAYVFEREIDLTDPRNPTFYWTEEFILYADDPTIGDNCGTSVSVSGDHAVIGAPGDNDQAVDAGSAFVFLRASDGS
jgi:hypothetical protein